MMYDEVIRILTKDKRDDFKIEDNYVSGKLEIEFGTFLDEPDLIKLLLLLDTNCSGGHSFGFEIEGEKFYLDGDGACKFKINNNRNKLKKLLK